MRTRASVAAIVTACALTAGVAYGSGGPSAVYNDYAADGVLSCNHSRADLEAVRVRVFVEQTHRFQLEGRFALGQQPGQDVQGQRLVRRRHQAQRRQAHLRRAL